MQTFVRWLMSVFLILILGFLFFTAIKNLEPVTIGIPFIAEYKVMTAVALATSFFAGCLVTSLFFGLWLAQNQWRTMSIQRELKKLKKDVAKEQKALETQVGVKF